MTSYQGLSTNNVTSKNSLFQNKRNLKGIFVSNLLLHRQNINEIEKYYPGVSTNRLSVSIEPPKNHQLVCFTEQVK
jgi:hypothetical protein